MLQRLARSSRQLGFTSWTYHFARLHLPSRVLLHCAMGSEDKKTRTTPRRRKRNAAASDPAADQEQASPAAAKEGEVTPSRRKAATSRSKKAKTAAADDQAVAEPPGPADAATADGAAAGGEKPSEPEAAAKPKPKRIPKPKWPIGPLYDVSMRPPKYDGPAHRFLSWNVAGMRALIKKDAEAIKNLVQLEQLDAVCLQEHKLQADHVDEVVKVAGLQDWHVTFNCSTAKKGYSGTATLCRQKPLSTRLGIGIEEHDDEGRVVTVELPDLWLVNVYVPNSGEGLRRLDYRITKWDKALADYVKGLHAQGKPVVITGDFNCAHQEIDIHDPKGNLRSAGFTQEERDSFGAELLDRAGLVDTWRAQHPGIVGYTYYSYRFNMRDKGKGWRLDYFLVTSDLADKVHDSYILKDIKGSDHAPLGIVLKPVAET